MGKDKEILDNGLVLITHDVKYVHTVCISFAFRVGSAYESDFDRGITHLVEHLFFRRLSELEKKELYREFNLIGAEMMAKTYCDYVEFSVSVVPRFQMQAFKLMVRLLDVFSWTVDEINSERIIVKKQIANKVQSYSEWINSIYFKNSIYEHPVMSNAESVDAIPYENINIWKNSFFSVRNACCVITGNYEDENILIWKQILSAITPFGETQPVLNILPINFGKHTSIEQYYIVENDSSNSSVVILFDIYDCLNFEAVRLLVSILGEGCNSLLSICLREQCGLTDDVFVELDCFNGFKRLSVSFDVNNEDLNESLCSFFDIIKNIDNHISTKELETSIVFFTDNQLKDYDDVRYLNHEYVICDFAIPTIISEPIEKKSTYEKITVSEIIECAKHIFLKSNFSAIIETDNKSEGVIDCIERCWKDFSNI